MKANFDSAKLRGRAAEEYTKHRSCVFSSTRRSQLAIFSNISHQILIKFRFPDNPRSLLVHKIKYPEKNPH